MLTSQQSTLTLVEEPGDEYRKRETRTQFKSRGELFRQYARQQRYGIEIQNSGAEIKIRAERRMGELLREMKEGGLAIVHARLKEERHQAIIKTPSDTCTVEDLYRLIDARKRFGTIYADPPWRYDNQSTRASTNNHYRTMTPDEIATLPVDHLTDGLSASKHTGFFGVFHKGIYGRQGMVGKLAFERAHHVTPGRS